MLILLHAVRVLSQAFRKLINCCENTSSLWERVQKSTLKFSLLAAEMVQHNIMEVNSHTSNLICSVNIFKS